jgi:hypothetical protein
MSPHDQSRTALDAAYATGSDRIAQELDGQVPPPVAQAQAPATVTAGLLASEPSASVGTTPEGPGFWSRLWDGVREAAPVVGQALVIDAQRRAAASQSPADLPMTQPDAPRRPMWLPWVLGAAVLGIVLALAFRRA